jgi:transposase
MAKLARGALRKKQDQLTLALHGKIEDHHRFMLQTQLERVERIAADIKRMDARIDDELEPHQAEMELLRQIPGVDRIVAMTIIAELGTDMSVFPSASHASAWAGVCPGNNESAGKRRGRAKRHGNVHLTTALVQAAFAASRKKGSYLKERFWRLAARRGRKRAALAVAHSILVAAYQMLRTGETYRDLGVAYLDERRKCAVERQLIRRLEALGHEVTLRPNSAA